MDGRGMGWEEGERRGRERRRGGKQDGDGEKEGEGMLLLLGRRIRICVLTTVRGIASSYGGLRLSRHDEGAHRTEPAITAKQHCEK